MKDTNLINFENDYFSANIDNFPFLYITFTGKNASDKEFEEYINYLDTIYTQKNQFVMLSDARKGNYLKSKHRIDLGNWTKQNKESIEQLCKGVAFVMSSIIMKTMLQGIFIIQAPPYPYTVVEDMEKAEIWLKEQLEK